MSFFSKVIRWIMPRSTPPTPTAVRCPTPRPSVAKVPCQPATGHGAAVPAELSASAELELIRRDPLLTPFEPVLRRRLARVQERVGQLRGSHPRLAEFAAGHEFFGLQRLPDGGWVFREWAPNASGIALVGDFNDWQECDAYRLEARGHGVWEREFPADALAHGQLYHLRMRWPDGEGTRLPAWGRRMVQDEGTKLFAAQVWEPAQSYVWRTPHFRRDPAVPPLIYEAHIGMAQEDGKVGSYREFEMNVLPRIIKGGYNTVQIMAIQEHPYYGSFGYHVSNFFAASSRFGTPEELKSLVDSAHAAGLAVIMDLIHSHAVKNETEGLGRFDGSLYQFFHDGPRGEHAHWDSRCFDYGKPEVLHFLLSNCRYWLDEFKFDGFRFDGVTSMLYLDHGMNRIFASYEPYFDSNVDEDALVYLALANRVIHQVREDALTVAEDVSGMPGLAVSPAHGGIGFDFRLAMGLPDFWIKLLKEVRDEDWPLGQLWHELNNRRPDERTVSYVESHDQAIVGDQTAIMRMLGGAIYHDMTILAPSPAADRAIALHKMMRLITLATGGGAYLAFMGNEFGHPEWIDFPREGNGWSYHHARRQWSLAEDPLLRYHGLGLFDAAMIRVAKSLRLLSTRQSVHLAHHHDADRVIAFRRGELLLVFNFSPDRSYPDYGIELPAGKYTQLLDSDATEFGGHGRLQPGQEHFTRSMDGNGTRHQLQLYLPSRSAQILRRSP